MMGLVATTVRGSSHVDAGCFCHSQILAKMLSSPKNPLTSLLPLDCKRIFAGHGCSRDYYQHPRGCLNSRLFLGRGYSVTFLSIRRVPNGLPGSRTCAPRIFGSEQVTSSVLSVIRSNARLSTVNNPAEQSPPVSRDLELASSPFNLRMADERFMRAIMFEASKGYINATGKISRFDEFLQCQLAALVSRNDLSLGMETCEQIQEYVEASRSYDQLSPSSRLLLLDGVVQMWGFRGVQDMVAFQEANQDLECSEKQNEERKLSDVLNTINSGDKCGAPETFACLKINSHPAIVFGSSDPVELYDPSREGNYIVRPAVSPNTTSVPQKRMSATGSQQHLSMDQLLKKNGSSKKPKAPRTESRIGIRPVDLVMQHEHKIGAKSRGGSVSSWDEGVLRTLISKVKVLSHGLKSRLEENGFHTVHMLLHHVPRTYVNFEQAEGVIESGQHVSFTGTILSSRGVILSASLGLVEVVVTSISERLKGSTGSSDWQDPEDIESIVTYLHLKRFFRGSRYANRGFLDKMSSKHTVGAAVTASGKVKAMAEENHFEIREFNLDIWDQQDPGSKGGSTTEITETLVSGKPHPVYSAKGDLQPKLIGQSIQRVLMDLPLGFDPLPEDLLKDFNLLELRQAYIGIHMPTNLNEAEQARNRLVFDEFFYLQLAMLLKRQQVADSYLAASGLAKVNIDEGSLDIEKWSPLTLKMVKSLPYSLTSSQKKAASEIMADLQSPVPMSRLLQGDVGCGKTVVAFLALLEVIDAGYQGALMAPTEFLANQHYQRIIDWLNEIEEAERPSVALLTGSTTLSKARAIRSGLENGDINLAIGTHSLISESVKFGALGLAVIDEQHRFGVEQRGRLHSKGPAVLAVNNVALDSAPDQVESPEKNFPLTLHHPPHILAMSATPIPRSLALAMHGDMGLSQITELPPGRPPIVTHVFSGTEKGRREAYKLVAEELESGGRAFFVFPVIETSEQLPDVRAATAEFGNLEKDFSGFKCGLVHGRMKPHEKEEAMHLFKTGQTQLLVSTTVIEVGIDIPEASVMVIEHADRYGMAQLHQLRGRVGRGTRNSICILLGSSSSLGRLKLLEKSRDGFYLAEVDLESRGPGELLGKRQSGNLPEFSIARIETDGRILQDARAAAEEVLQAHHQLEDLPLLKRELSMRRPPVLD